MAVVALPEYLRRMPASHHPDDLLHHNCIRLWFAAEDAIYKEEFRPDDRLADYEVGGNLIISDTTFSLNAVLEGVGLAYTLARLAEQHIKDWRLQRVLPDFSPTFPGFHLYSPSKHKQPSKRKALIEYVGQHKF